MGASFLTHKEWEKLLRKTGLKDLIIRSYKVNFFEQVIKQRKWFSFRDYFNTWKNYFFQLKNPAYRKFIKKELTYPGKLFNYMGYEIYVRVK